MALSGNDMEEMSLKISLLILICGDSSTFSILLGEEKICV